MAVFLLTCEVVARWMEYCVLKASMRVRSCTFEFTAIVIDSRVYSSRQAAKVREKEIIFKALGDTCLDNFELNLVITVFRAAANCLHDRIDEESRSFTVARGRLLPLLVLAVVRAVPIEEIVAEKFLDAVEELLDEARQLALDRHL